MKKYCNVYIRRAAGWLGFASYTSSNILDSFDMLELAATGAKITVEPQKVPLGDGTEFVESERVSFEGGTMRIEQSEYDYLRAEFHNQFVDVLLLDPEDVSLAIIALRLKGTVSKIVESGQTIVTKISGMREASVDCVQGFEIGVLGSFAYLHGLVVDYKGNPFDGVSVALQVDGATIYTDTTDKDGRFMIIARVASPSSNCSYAATKSGHDFGGATSLVMLVNSTNEVLIAERD